MYPCMQRDSVISLRSRPFEGNGKSKLHLHVTRFDPRISFSTHRWLVVVEAWCEGVVAGPAADRLGGGRGVGEGAVHAICRRHDGGGLQQYQQNYLGQKTTNALIIIMSHFCFEIRVDPTPKQGVWTHLRHWRSFWLVEPRVVRHVVHVHPEEEMKFNISTKFWEQYFNTNVTILPDVGRFPLAWVARGKFPWRWSSPPTRSRTAACPPSYVFRPLPTPPISRPSEGGEVEFDE